MNRPLAPNPNRFEIGDFVSSHGKGPRGRGTWMFEVFYCDGSVIVYQVLNQIFTKAKADCVRQSRARFGRRAWNVIQVMP